MPEKVLLWGIFNCCKRCFNVSAPLAVIIKDFIFSLNEKNAAPQIDHLLGQALHDHSVMVHRQQINK